MRSGRLWRLWPLLPVALALVSVVMLLGMQGRSRAERAGIPNGGFEEPGETGFPEGWQSLNRGLEGTRTYIWWTAEVSHESRRSLRAEALDPGAEPGVVARVPVEAGWYELRLFARAAEGEEGFIQCSVAGHEGPVVRVGDGWTEVVNAHEVGSGRVEAEVGLWNRGGPGVVFFDDVSLRPVQEPQWKVVADGRPADEQPRLLYLCGNPSYFADTAGEWSGRGFSGFSCAQVIRDWAQDVWSVDGDPDSTGDGDALLREVREAVVRCGAGGLTDCAMTVGLHTPLPDPLDDSGYGMLVRNLRQAARFCREASLRLLILDTKYAAGQFSPTWPGYDMSRRVPEGLAAQLRERWQDVGRGIAAEAPELDVAVTPEGMLYYDRLWVDLFSGLLEGLSVGGTRGGVHVFCQGTYTVTDPAGIRNHAATVREMTRAALSGGARELWEKRGHVALGAWPLGYYRAVNDIDGRLLGWSGRRETFGDRLVGAFCDKSANYSPEQFRVQLAAIRAYSDVYCFVYGHGASWFSLTDEQVEAYGRRVCRFSVQNYRLPTVSNIDGFHGVCAERPLVRVEEAEGERGPSALVAEPG